MTPVWQRVSWWIGIVFAGVGVVVIASTFGLTLRGKLFPLAIGIPVVLLGLAHTVVSLWNGALPGSGADGGESAGSTALDLRATLYAFAWILGMILAVLLIGQRIAIPLFVATYMVANGERLWKGLLGAALTAAFIYFVLEETIGVSFPLPYLEYWLR